MNQLRSTIVSLLLFSLLFGGLYPLFATGMANALFVQQAQGSLMHGRDGKPLGSALIGQNFTQPQYFWGRLSGTTPAYNAASSSGTNYGSNNPALLDAAQARVTALGGRGPVPIDLVTASGSGLDPDISPEAAEYQVARVAQTRGWSADKVRAMVAKHTQGRQFGLLGEPRVHVLELNLALDGKL